MTKREASRVSWASFPLTFTGGNVLAAGSQNRSARVLIAVLVVAMGAACSTRTYPRCDNDSDCNKEGHKGVCIDGTCQECGKDSDCQTGFHCDRNRCVPKPECQTDAECTSPKVCRNERCVLECGQDADCTGGQICKNNRCTPKGPCKQDSECGPKGKCLEGKCASAMGPCTLDSVHFAYNESTLDDQAKATLQKNADCMKSNPPVGKVTVEANCDERGTEEYNLHLGQRRADAASKYVVNLGISKAQLKTISYGKDKPICTDSNESCWGQNRRVDFTQPQ
jgi:peptidoglycan-associated lipoprotein